MLVLLITFAVLGLSPTFVGVLIHAVDSHCEIMDCENRLHHSRKRTYILHFKGRRLITDVLAVQKFINCSSNVTHISQ